MTVAILTALTLPAAAEGVFVRADDSALHLAAGIGKQVSVRFSEAFASLHLSRSDYDGVVLSGTSENRICLFGPKQGIDSDDPKLADVARKEERDVCVPRSEVSLKVPATTAEGVPAVPFYSTDLARCAWSWKTGTGIGLWTEDCRFESGHWTVSYDVANDWFGLSVDDGEPYPVVRQFHVKKGLGPESLLPELKAKGLVLDDPDCLFDVSPDSPAPPGWVAWQVFPVGARKQLFEAQPKDEVPEPPCGELGMAVDSTGYFAMTTSHPDRVIYVNLGQDGTMIDPASITFQ